MSTVSLIRCETYESEALEAAVRLPVESRRDSRSSALLSQVAGEPSAQLLVHQQGQDHDGGHDGDGPGRQHPPAHGGFHPTEEAGQAHGESLGIPAGQKQGEEVLVPGENQGENGHRGHSRKRTRQHHSEENHALRGPVDGRSLVYVPGDVVEEGAHQPDDHGQVDDDVHKQQSAQGTDDAKLHHDKKHRQGEDDVGHEAHRQDRHHDRLSAGNGEAGQPEGRRDAEGHAQGYGGQGNDGAVTEVGEEALVRHAEIVLQGGSKEENRRQSHQVGGALERGKEDPQQREYRQEDSYQDGGPPQDPHEALPHPAPAGSAAGLRT